MRKNIEVSVIVVHFGHGLEIFKCLRSLNEIKSRFKPIEFILVDNNEEKLEKARITRIYPWINYVSTPKNLGWGGGHNFGFRKAKGKYILFMDSDILIRYSSFINLYTNIKEKGLGIVSPRINNISGKLFVAGSRELTPVRGIYYLSFINKLFPNNFIVKKFLMRGWSRKKPRIVDVVPLAAFMIKKKAYEEVNGFDENLFLYFEENDISNSLNKKGWKLFLDVKSKVTHLESKSTPKETKKIKEIYKKSRFYYFRKHYGVLSALLVEFFAHISKQTVIILGILLVSIFLRFYRFYPNLPFNGEMGTDYMNIWNIIHGSRTFLIGPRTSHEWFFISPIAYWIYAVLLKIWNYNPVVINIFWGIVGSSAVLVSYAVLKKMFSKNVALISSFLIAISPDWIMQTRNSRYNLVVSILFLPYLLYLRDSIKDKGKSLLKLGLILGLTMSFFPSPILLIPAAIVCFAFYRVVPKFKYILHFVLGFLIPNVPFLIYEMSNRFAITIQIVSWVPYRVLGFFGLYQKNTADSTVLSQNIYSIYHFFAESFVGYANVLTIILFFMIVACSILLVRRFYRNKSKEIPFFLLIISLLISYIGLFIHGNPPEHYYYVVFPAPAILAAYILDKLVKKKFVLTGAVLILGMIGIFGLLKINWFILDKQPINYEVASVPYITQLEIADTIYRNSNGSAFSIGRIGINDQFENNFANNYIYLLTIKGANIQANSKVRYTIIEGKDNYQKLHGSMIFSENDIYVFKSIQ